MTEIELLTEIRNSLIHIKVIGGMIFVLITTLFAVHHYPN